MFCLFCNNEDTDVVNSRATRGGSQIWRRRKCSVCGKAATTYERYDMTHLSIVTPSAAEQPLPKGSGQLEAPYSRSKLFYSLGRAFTQSQQDITQVDDIIDTIEIKLITDQTVSLTRLELASIVLETVKPVNLSAFMHYLASHGRITNKTELRKAIKQY